MRGNGGYGGPFGSDVDSDAERKDSDSGSESDSDQENVASGSNASGSESDQDERDDSGKPSNKELFGDDSEDEELLIIVGVIITLKDQTIDQKFLNDLTMKTMTPQM